ncbi:hypothetical protein [Sphingopyxis sp.]|uniref:hypothetical protein n=1 Tax=Sphingopyxis sp. TaxID=1908224 RepID=UPI002D767B49|nr:hypothetical protein [Sphingopyxis sp.]HET6523187.1 hypothetical protein [Sphingopyxis sp.]
MMMQTHAMAARLSKFKVGDLALKSALELERARAGMKYDKSQLAELAEALRVSAGEADGSGKVAYMRPGYFEPFERVYRSSHAAEPKSFDDIHKFMVRAIADIDAAASRKINETLMAKLVDFCLELNREFVRRPPTENRVGRRERSVSVEAFVR